MLTKDSCYTFNVVFLGNGLVTGRGREHSYDLTTQRIVLETEIDLGDPP